MTTDFNTVDDTDDSEPRKGGAPRKSDDETIVLLLALGCTHEKIAARLNISERTVSRRRRELNPLIRQKRADLLSETAGQLAAMARDATVVLAEHLSSDEPATQIAAVKTVLDRLTKFHDAATRADALERQELEDRQAVPVTSDSWPGWNPEWPERRPATVNPWTAAETAVRESRWTWRHIWDLASHGAVEAIRNEIVRLAREARAERKGGGAPPYESALDAAAFIVSYRPDETVPVIGTPDGHKPVWMYIDDETALIDGAHAGTPAFGIGVHAGSVKLALGTRDGLELRRIVWRDDDQSEPT